MRRLLIIIGIFLCSLFNQNLANTMSANNVMHYERFDSILRDSITSFASKYEGYEYAFGSIGPNSFDCSGFTSFILKNFNIENVNRTARDQYKQGVQKCIDSAKPGDLIFFSCRGKFIGHVGVVTGRDENNVLMFIHASSRKSGVIKSKLTGYYAKRFVGIRDIVTPNNHKYKIKDLNSLLDEL